MRSKVALVAALCLALVVPASALGAAPGMTSLQDTAIAYYLSPDGSQCAILTLAWVAQRPPDGALSYSQHLDVQLSGPTCQPSNTSNEVDLDATAYRIVGLTDASVRTSLTVAGHLVSVDVAWTATGTPQIYSDQWANNTVVITRDVSASLAGTVLVDGEAWTADQQTALLMSGTFTNFPVAPTPATTPANVALGARATASSWFLQTSDPGKAVDGDPSTLWNSGGFAPQWIEIDLGRDYPISAIALMTAQYPMPALTVHRVTGRAAGSATVVLLHEFSGTTLDGQWLTADVPSSPCLRYVRVATTSSPFWVAWKEIEVLATGGAGNQACPTASPTPAPTPPPAAKTYIVVAGDTLWAIARMYRVSLPKLIAANPQITNPNLIYPGDRVAIPQPTPPPATDVGSGPASGHGAKSVLTAKYINSVAYFDSGHNSCLIMSMSKGQTRQADGTWSNGAVLDIQVFNLTCNEQSKPGLDEVGVELQPGQYVFDDLSAAHVAVPVTVAGRTFTFDVAWVAAGTPAPYVQTLAPWAARNPDPATWVGKVVAAHVTGVLLDPEGEFTIGNLMPTAILRTQDIYQP